MLVTALRVAAVILVGAFIAYTSHRITREYYENNIPHDNISDASRRRKRCIICHKTDNASLYDNKCGCFCHTACMEILLKEGQDKCPGCKEPLNNVNAPRAGGNNWAHHRQSFAGTNQEKKFFYD